MHTAPEAVQSPKFIYTESATNMKRVTVLKDFFGIKNLTTKEVAGLLVKSKLTTQKISSKFNLLMVARDSPENEEVTHDKGYGTIRYDDQNTTSHHGQYEPRNSKTKLDTADVKQRYSTKRDELEEIAAPADEQLEGAIKISEVRPERELSEVLALFRSVNTDPSQILSSPEPLLTSPRPRIERKSSDDSPRPKIERETSDDSSDNNLSKVPPAIQTKLPDLSKARLDYSSFDDDTETSEDAEDKDSFPFEEDEQADYRQVDSAPTNALQYIKSIRAGKTEPQTERLKSRLQHGDTYPLKPKILLDSHGFKNYSQQVPDWDNCRRIDILNHINASIIYHNYDVLAINKPYGIASHCDSKREKIDMNRLVHEIAAWMKIEKVYLAHRLDKTTTGVLLFATSQKRADQLHKLFRSDQIKKTYWCITRGVPDPGEAIIDIPVGEFSVTGKVRSCLAPENIEKKRQMTKRYREARRAITEYNVIQSHKQVALVEVKPRTGVKHQIRCHLGFGLNRPILGDHKYSHLGKLAPQELPVSVLNRLHLRQTKVRTLPLHLHAKTIVVPGIKPNGQNLFIEAPLPPHFKDNLKALGLLTREVIENL